MWRRLILAVFMGFLLAGCGQTPTVEEVEFTVSPDDLPALEAHFEALLERLEPTMSAEEVAKIRRGWEGMKLLGSGTAEGPQYQAEYLASINRLLEMAVGPDHP